MSKAKLTMQDIVNTIAGKAGVTKTAAEEFSAMKLYPWR